MTRGREIRLASRPTGAPTADNFELAEVDLPAPADGEVLVRNLFMSVDPYMRGRMNDVKSYVPPFQLGAALDGGAVGEVVESADPDLSVGDMVLHGLGWRDYAIMKASGARKIDPKAAPTLSAYLGVLGMPGHTAYVGLLDIAAMQPGETVFVSGAAGAVGSLAGQIAKARGAARVVGSAGSAAKVARVTELGFDAAFDYHDGPVRHRLKEAAPDGIDVYFDNVGGEHLEAAIGALNLRGRAVICGMISQYNSTEPTPGPRNMVKILQNRLRVEGVLVGDHYDLQPEFVQEVGPWVASGQLKYRETVVEGIENNLEAFLGVLRGDNTGKMIVKL